MTKKDYERAATIAQRYEQPKRTAVVQSFVDLFRPDNGRFDEERFRRACEPGANVRARA